MKQDTNNKSLALEMLEELKRQARRWFIIAIIELILIIATNIGWLLYEAQFEEITSITDEAQTIEDIDNADNSTFTQTIK